MDRNKLQVHLTFKVEWVLIIEIIELYNRAWMFRQWAVTSWRHYSKIYTKKKESHVNSSYIHSNEASGEFLVHIIFHAVFLKLEDGATDHRYKLWEFNVTTFKWVLLKNTPETFFAIKWKNNS